MRSPLGGSSLLSTISVGFYRPKSNRREAWGDFFFCSRRSHRNPFFDDRVRYCDGLTEHRTARRPGGRASKVFPLTRRGSRADLQKQIRVCAARAACARFHRALCPIFRRDVLSPLMGILTTDGLFGREQYLEAFLLGAIIERAIHHRCIDRASDQRGETGVRAARNR